MTYDPNDAGQVAEARRKAEQEAALRQVMLRNIMTLPEGRRWIYELLSWCHIFGPTFIQGSADGTAWQEGMRNVGLRVMMDVLEASPEMYMRMVQEAKTSD